MRPAGGSAAAGSPRSAARRWFDEVERVRLRGEQPQAEDLTLAEFAERYLQAHAVGREESTIDRLGRRLAHALRAFGDRKLSELERMTADIAAWRATLPAGSRYGIVQALRQTLEAAVRWDLMARNPAKLAGSNPQPKRPEIEPFTRPEVDRLAVELGPWGRWRSSPARPGFAWPSGSLWSGGRWTGRPAWCWWSARSPAAS